MCLAGAGLAYRILRAKPARADQGSGRSQYAAVPGGDSSAAEEDAFESAYRVRSQRGRSLLESDNTGFEMTSDRFESRFGVLDSGYDGV